MKKQKPAKTSRRLDSDQVTLVLGGSRRSTGLLVTGLTLALMGQACAGMRQGFEATSPEYERRDQEVSEEDLEILRKAQSILADESAWDRQDDRVCEATDTTWSLFCALHKASLEVLGEYQHRRVALQEVRFAIEDVSGGEKFAHRLMDFNNTRSFEEVGKVLTIATRRVEERLADQ